VSRRENGSSDAVARPRFTAYIVVCLVLMLASYSFGRWSGGDEEMGMAAVGRPIAVDQSPMVELTLGRSRRRMTVSENKDLILSLVKASTEAGGRVASKKPGR
jgi:hypothetical protein